MMEIETSDQLEDRPLNVGAFLQCQNSGFVDLDPNTRPVAKAIAKTPQSLPFVCCWQGAHSSFWKLCANRSVTSDLQLLLRLCHDKDCQKV